MADPNQNSYELAEALARISDEFRRFGDVTEDSAAALKRAQELRTRELKTAGASAADALGHVGSAAMSSAKAMLNGEKGAAAFNSSLDDMALAAKAVGVTLSFLMPGGLIVKGLIAGATALTSAVTSYAKAANEMSDKLYKGFSGMATSGAAAADGMTGLFKDAKRLGLSMNELDGFVQMVGENSKDLALFGGAVFAGRKKFAEVGEAMEPYRESLFKAGFTQDQVNKATMGYIRLQSQIGLSQDKTTGQLAEGARKYLLEQDALTKLTGMTREDAEKARERVRGQEQFAAKSLELRMQNNEEGAQRLEDFYLLIASQDEATAKGMADIAAGNLLTDEAQKVFRATNGKILEYNEKLISGEMTAVQAMQQLGTTIGDTVKESGATLGKVGNYSKYIGNLAGHVKLSTLAAGDLEKNYQKILQDREKSGVEGGKAADELMEDRAKLIKAQQDANKATESFIFSGMVPAQKAMVKLAEVTGAGVDKVSNMFGHANDEVGGAQSGAFTEEEATAAKPMLAKAEQERSIFASEEFKNWQKEQGAGMLQKGMYHEKYGVAAYMKEKGIEESKPVERAVGSLGSVGKLIEDFGPGTPAILHGREGVVTEDQMRAIIEQAKAIGSGTAAPGVNTADAKKYADKLNESTDLLDEQNEIDTDTLDLKKSNYAAEKKQAQVRIDLGKKEKLLADEDVRKYRNFVDEKNLYYEDLLDFIDEQFGILEQTAGTSTGMPGGGGGGSMPGTSGAAATGARSRRSERRQKYSAATEGEEPAVTGASSGSGGATSGEPGQEGFQAGTPQTGVIGKLLDYIGKHESNGNYNILVGGKTDPNLTNMTVGEVLEFQKQMRAKGHESTAVGKYQIISGTLLGLVKEGHASLTDKFDPATQDKLAIGLLKRRGLDKYMSGELNADRFANKLAMEWASLPTSEGKSYYAGVGSNRSGDSRENFMKSVFARDGGVFSGPTTGYPATLHGTEAVIPLKDGAVPVQMPGMEVVATQNEELKTELSEMRKEIKDLLAQLTEAVNTAKNSGARERMVSVLETIARAQSSTADLSRKLVQQGAS